MESLIENVDTAYFAAILGRALAAAESGDYEATTQLFGIEYAEVLEGLGLWNIAFQAIEDAGLSEKFTPNNAVNKLQEGRKLARLGARGRSSLEMRLRYLEEQVEELVAASESARYGDGS